MRSNGRLSREDSLWCKHRAGGPLTNSGFDPVFSYPETNLPCEDSEQRCAWQ